MSKMALVVDDSTSMRQMVAFTLQSAGFTVIEGADGKDALGKVNGKAVNLVVTDLNMPVMDGISLIRELRKQAYELMDQWIASQTTSGSYSPYVYKVNR